MKIYSNYLPLAKVQRIRKFIQKRTYGIMTEARKERFKNKK